MENQALKRIGWASSEVMSVLRAAQVAAECVDRAIEAMPTHADQLRDVAGKLWGMAADARVLEASVAEVYADARSAEQQQRGAPPVRADRIRDVIRFSATPMTPEEILIELHKSGDMTATAQIVTNALTALMNRGAVCRPERGRYVSAGL